MKFSEALEQYLDARDYLANEDGERGSIASRAAHRQAARETMREAAERMDELAPVRD